jgi:hypothetical protein
MSGYASGGGFLVIAATIRSIVSRSQGPTCPVTRPAGTCFSGRPFRRLPAALIRHRSDANFISGRPFGSAAAQPHAQNRPRLTPCSSCALIASIRLQARPIPGSPPTMCATTPRSTSSGSSSGTAHPLTDGRMGATAWA